MSISVESVSYVYSPDSQYKTVALDKISFSIEQGEIVAIIGHTGSGKSTLVQLLNGLLRPTSGKILIDNFILDQRKQRLAELRKKVGLVFQYPEYQLFEETVEKDIAFGPRNLGCSEEEIDFRIKEAMNLLHLDYDQLAKRSPFDLSGGQKRRVAIAGVLAMKPNILMLDEPTAGLDPRATRELLGVLKELQKNQGITMIFISHSMDEVATLAARVLVLEKGKLILDEKTEELFKKKDELRRAGLDVPEITKLISKLNQKACTQFSHSIFNSYDLMDQIKENL